MQERYFSSDITKLSRAMTGKKRYYSIIQRTPWNYKMPGQAIKDNGVFVKGEINYGNRRSHSR
jgi:hypothetical protein